MIDLTNPVAFEIKGQGIIAIPDDLAAPRRGCVGRCRISAAVEIGVLSESNPASAGGA